VVAIIAQKQASRQFYRLKVSCLSAMASERQIQGGRVGHVFQGQFKVVLVERDGYLLELAQYVVMRAGMVSELESWR